MGRHRARAVAGTVPAPGRCWRRSRAAGRAGFVATALRLLSASSALSAAPAGAFPP